MAHGDPNERESIPFPDPANAANPATAAQYAEPADPAAMAIFKAMRAQENAQAMSQDFVFAGNRRRREQPGEPFLNARKLEALRELITLLREIDFNQLRSVWDLLKVFFGPVSPVPDGAQPMVFDWLDKVDITRVLKLVADIIDLLLDFEQEQAQAIVEGRMAMVENFELPPFVLMLLSRWVGIDTATLEQIIAVLRALFPTR